MTRELESHNGWAVRAENLTRKFGDFVAVDRIALAVKPGEIFGFLGANGAGKTTTIRMLCGLLMPSDGEAWVDGLPISTESDAIKRRIGYMSQKFSLYMDLTVAENLEFYGGVYGLASDMVKARSNEAMSRLGLADFSKRLPSALPFGFRQRLALGSALLHRPKIVFLDEPTGGVDPVARRTFWDIIYDLADGGTTVFVTTHYMDEAEYCGRVSIMDQGQISALGSPDELKSQYNSHTMQDVFLKVVQP